MAKKSSQTGQEKRTAILKELESVRKMLNEDLEKSEGQGFSADDPANKDKMENILESVTDVRKEVQQEFQIPLLDPGKSTTHELDFSKPVPEESEPEQEFEPDLGSIPTIDDISASSSLFDNDKDEEDDKAQVKAPSVSRNELRAHAQLILQDLLNEAITEVEEKLDEWIPRLEIKLQKRLEKAIDDYIDKALKK